MSVFIARVLRNLDCQTVYRRTRRKPSSSVQFEYENDVIRSVINLNRSCFPIF